MLTLYRFILNLFGTEWTFLHCLGTFAHGGNSRPHSILANQAHLFNCEAQEWQSVPHAKQHRSAYIPWEFPSIKALCIVS